jgi:hypothetical protein
MEIARDLNAKGDAAYVISNTALLGMGIKNYKYPEYHCMLRGSLFKLFKNNFRPPLRKVRK